MIIKKKIIIIGLGNMGFAHLQSFSKQNFEIHIVEKNKTEKIKFLKKKNFLIKNLKFFHKIPKNNKYLLAISATQSKERYQLIKKLLISNSVKYLLLEKFSFLNLIDFKQFEKNFTNKTKTFINSWAYIIAKRTKLKSKLNNFTIECQVPEDSLLSNITHMLHILSYLNKKRNIKKFYNSKCNITKSLKRKSYNEIIGEIKLEDTSHNILKIKTKKKMSNFMKISILQKKPKINYQILFKNNFTVYLKQNKKIIDRFKFPLSSRTSSFFLKNCLKNNFNYMPSFKLDYSLSKMLLEKYDVKIP